jgi:hypothetical protein
LSRKLNLLGVALIQAPALRLTKREGFCAERCTGGSAAACPTRSFSTPGLGPDLGLHTLERWPIYSPGCSVQGRQHKAPQRHRVPLKPSISQIYEPILSIHVQSPSSGFNDPDHIPLHDRRFPFLRMSPSGHQPASKRFTSQTGTSSPLEEVQQQKSHSFRRWFCHCPSNEMNGIERARGHLCHLRASLGPTRRREKRDTPR